MLTGQQLKASSEFIHLRDGRLVKLELDFNATMAYERDFILPRQTKIEEAHEELSRGEKPATNEQVFEFCERQGIIRATCRHEEQARWAYALGESWREDNPAQQMTFKEFRRLLPFGDQMDTWSDAVNRLLNQFAPEEEKKSEPRPSADSLSSVDEKPIGDTSSGSSPSDGGEGILPNSGG